MIDWDLWEALNRFVADGGRTIQDSIEVFSPSFQDLSSVCDEGLPNSSEEWGGS